MGALPAPTLTTRPSHPPFSLSLPTHRPSHRPLRSQGRAGHTGKAITFFNRNNGFLARDLERLLSENKQAIPDWLGPLSYARRVYPPREDRGASSSSSSSSGGGGGRGGRRDYGRPQNDDL